MNIKDFCSSPICEHCIQLGSLSKCNKTEYNENKGYSLIKNMEKCPDESRNKLKLKQKLEKVVKLESTLKNLEKILE